MNLQERVKKFNWYHRIELPGGVVTPGTLPACPEKYHLPMSMAGWRVLDIGAWDGYWTWACLKLGARQVVAIEDFSDDLGWELPRKEIAWQTFDLCRDALGYTAEQADHQTLSLYEVTPARLGEFDLVLFYGTIYHCRYPLLALDILSRVCKCQIRIESAILNDWSAYRGGMGTGYGEQTVAEFYPGTEYGHNQTNWWNPTLTTLTKMVQAAGWTPTDAWKMFDPPTELWQCRGLVTGQKEAAHA